MNSKLNKSKLTYRRLKLTDYHQFKKLFHHCFNKEISFDFFKWRYFNDRHSFCYGVFKSSRLIANVGMFSMKLNNNSHDRLFSRHSSMVLKEYRSQGVFSDLLNRVKKIISKKVRLIVMWPNKKNFSSFSIDKKRIIKKKYYIYKSSSKSNLLNIKKIYNVDKLINLKNKIESKNSFFLKDFDYFKNRYLSYQKFEYLIDKFEFKKLQSFFILKVNKDGLNENYVIVDHFGSEKIKSKHLSNLIKNQKKLIFLSKKKITKTNLKLLNNIYFKIAFIKKPKHQEKKNFLKKEIFLGDTDTFITIRRLKFN